jgi:hypothetical protein
VNLELYSDLGKTCDTSRVGFLEMFKCYSANSAGAMDNSIGSSNKRTQAVHVSKVASLPMD